MSAFTDETKTVFWQAILFLEEFVEAFSEKVHKPKSHITHKYWTFDGTDPDVNNPCVGVAVGTACTTKAKDDAGKDLVIDFYFWMPAPGNHWTDMSWIVDLSGEAHATWQAMKESFHGAEFRTPPEDDTWSMALPWGIREGATDDDVRDAARTLAAKIAETIR